MDATGLCEIVSMYQTTWCHVPEKSNLQIVVVIIIIIGKTVLIEPEPSLEDSSRFPIWFSLLWILQQ
jgi:hypothetical protein